jgi:hypothetical protein
MKLKKPRQYHIVWSISKSNIAERDNIDTPNTHKYMTAHFPGLEQAHKSKVVGLN